MKRSPMPPRTVPLRSSPIARKRRTKAEREEKFAREYGSKERVEWIADLPCLVSGAGPCENAHTWNRGKGLKGPPESIVPLTAARHRELHQIGVLSFEAKYAGPLLGATLRWWAALIERRWQRERGLTPLSAIIPGVVASLLEQRAEESA